MAASSTTPAPRRPRLTFSLRTFLVVTLALSLLLGYFGRAWWKAYRDSQPPTLHELAQIARRHGIPMPPQGAKLVLVLAISSPHTNGPIYEYTPGFLLREDADRLVTLVGSKEESVEKEWHLQTTAPLWREFSPRNAPADADRYTVDYSPSSALVCAVQLYDQGERKAAKGVLAEV